MNLLTTPPTAALLASLSRVLREGIPQIPALTPATAWAAGAPCPAGHPIFPAGARIYDYMQAKEVDGEVFVELLIPGEESMDVEREDRMWNIPVEINIFWDRDIWDGEEGQQLQAVLKMLLTNAITLPDGSVQSAQARLSTAGLHVWGTRDSENFTGQKFEKLGVNEGHPFLSFGCTILCSGIYQPDGSVPNQTADATLSAPAYADALDALNFAQTTDGRTLTLEAPTDGSRKVLTVSNTGTASFTLAPLGLSGGLTIASGASSVLIHWDTALEAWATGI